ncbi:MAG: type II toxin-antitoxin system VapC family toxin [Candidatus Riflebacteria bacterium]|nr:type II toxin-antitoxin system VapC family toxin [Candidatus Riflebacteria bacterium]
MSVWELCLKWQAGKLSLPQPPSVWVEEQCRSWGLIGLAVERRHLYRVSELPVHHRDPFDRLLIAQAIEGRLTLATPDRVLSSYPVAVLW